MPSWLEKGVRLRRPIPHPIPRNRTFPLANSDLAQLRTIHPNPEFALIHDQFVTAASAVNFRLTWSVWLLNARLTESEAECAAGFSIRVVALHSVLVDGQLIRATSYMRAWTKVESSYVCAKFDVGGVESPYWGRVRELVYHILGGVGTVFARCDWYNLPVTDPHRSHSPYLDSSIIRPAAEGEWILAALLVPQVVAIEGTKVYLLQA